MPQSNLFWLAVEFLVGALALWSARKYKIKEEFTHAVAAASMFAVEVVRVMVFPDSAATTATAYSFWSHAKQFAISELPFIAMVVWVLSAIRFRFALQRENKDTIDKQFDEKFKAFSALKTAFESSEQRLQAASDLTRQVQDEFDALRKVVAEREKQFNQAYADQDKHFRDAYEKQDAHFRAEHEKLNAFVVEKLKERNETKVTTSSSKYLSMATAQAIANGSYGGTQSEFLAVIIRGHSARKTTSAASAADVVLTTDVTFRHKKTVYLSKYWFEWTPREEGEPNPRRITIVNADGNPGSRRLTDTETHTLTGVLTTEQHCGAFRVVVLAGEHEVASAWVSVVDGFLNEEQLRRFARE